MNALITFSVILRSNFITLDIFLGGRKHFSNSGNTNINTEVSDLRGPTRTGVNRFYVSNYLHQQEEFQLSLHSVSGRNLDLFTWIMPHI